MKKILIYCLSAILFALASCDYEPEDLNPVEVAPPNPENAPVRLSLENADDTIYVYSEVLPITYDLASEGLLVYEVVFYFEGEEVHRDSPNQYSINETFTVEADSGLKGEYVLTAELTTPSTSDSLASVHGKEVTVLTYQWTLLG